MNRHIRSTIARIGFVVALTAASGVSMAAYNPDLDYGSRGQDNSFDRMITISANAKSVNVNRDESIKFVDAASGKSFVWRFNTLSSRLDLNKVAPDVLAGRSINVYIGESARESARRQ
jgi:Heavy-metal resistance protein CzcE